MTKSLINNELIEKSMALLHCPGCQAGQLEYCQNENIPSIICTGCHREYPVVNGIIDFFPEYTHGKGLAQKFMEKKSVVKIYEKYFRPVFTSLGSPVTYREEESWLKSVNTNKSIKRCLDIAAGTGRYARMLADIYEPEIVFAFDLSMPMLQKGMEDSISGGYTNIAFVRGDAQCMPFTSNSLDRINCFGALHLFPDPYGALKEVSRIGQDNTLFTCLTTCSADGFFSGWFQRFFSKIASFKFFNVEELEFHLEELGFIDIQNISSKMLLMFKAQLKKGKSGKQV